MGYEVSVDSDLEAVTAVVVPHLGPHTEAGEDHGIPEDQTIEDSGSSADEADEAGYTAIPSQIAEARYPRRYRRPPKHFEDYISWDPSQVELRAASDRGTGAATPYPP